MSVMSADETAVREAIDDALDFAVLESDVAEGYDVRPRPSHASGRRSAVALLVLGTAVMVAAAGLGLTSIRRLHAAKVPARAVAAEAASRPPTVHAEDVTVVNLSYEPGHSSGWHVHPGLHAVYVLSGALTVYDEACRPHVYGPGESYVGGQTAHVVRNETDAPTELIVTAIELSGPAGPGSHLPAPAGCPVS